MKPGILAILLGMSVSLFASSFYQTNLVSDISGMAPVTDSHLMDSWGMAFSATSPIWVADRASGFSTVYNGITGAPAPTGSPLVVAVPPGAPIGPTGVVFAGPATSFTLNGTPASFIFDTLGGTVDAWNGGTTATEVAATVGARYEGLASTNNTLYAANFVNGGDVNVFNSSYSQTGSFTDPTIPAGYAPFNVQNLNGMLYVEYAKLSPNIPVPLPGGGGYVDVFDTAGTLVKRLVSNGPLDAPWGIALAPPGFGDFGNDLLIGNFGNGEINAFNPSTGAFVGTVTDSKGNPIANSGLWAIAFGNSAANPNALYFTAGLNQRADGLFGDIQAVPEPGGFALIVLGLLGLAGYAGQRRSNT